VFTTANGTVNACHDINTGLKQYLPMAASARNCATDAGPVIISPLSTLQVQTVPLTAWAEVMVPSGITLTVVTLCDLSTLLVPAAASPAEGS